MSDLLQKIVELRELIPLCEADKNPVLSQELLALATEAVVLADKLNLGCADKIPYVYYRDTSIGFLTQCVKETEHAGACLIFFKIKSKMKGDTAQIRIRDSLARCLRTRDVLTVYNSQLFSIWVPDSAEKKSDKIIYRVNEALADIASVQEVSHVRIVYEINDSNKLSAFEKASKDALDLVTSA